MPFGQNLGMHTPLQPDLKPQRFCHGTCVLRSFTSPPHARRYILLAGAFPFLTMGEEALPPLQRLHAMVPRIMAGCPIALPQPVSSHLPDSV